MRTTIDLDDGLFKAAKQRAVGEGRTLTSVVEQALRGLLEPARTNRPRFRFRPIVKEGRRPPDVDIADRDALYERMDGRS